MHGTKAINTPSTLIDTVLVLFFFSFGFVPLFFLFRLRSFWPHINAEGRENSITRTAQWIFSTYHPI